MSTGESAVPARQATIKDVARAAGVSTATVSRVVSDNGYPVSAATKERVLDIVRRLGYSPNDLARSLLKERSLTVGVVVPDLSNPHHPNVVRGVEEVAVANGYSVLFCSTDDQPARLVSSLEMMAGKRVDGIILAGGGLDPTPTFDAVRTLHTKGVVVGRYAHSPFPSVESDNTAAGVLAADHLVDLGHTKIGVITGPTSATASADRLTGIRQVLRRLGQRTSGALVAEADFHASGGYAAAGRLLSARAKPTAIIAANDAMAIGAMAAAADLGLRIPDDLALVGYDDIVMARFLRPSLTSIALPTRSMGRQAMSLLLEMLRGRDVPARTVLDVQLAVRGSTVRDVPVDVAPRPELSAGVADTNVGDA